MAHLLGRPQMHPTAAKAESAGGKNVGTVGGAAPRRPPRPKGAGKGKKRGRAEPRRPAAAPRPKQAKVAAALIGLVGLVALVAWRALSAGSDPGAQVRGWSGGHPR
jgi:hypothetical protein